MRFAFGFVLLSVEYLVFGLYDDHEWFQDCDDGRYFVLDVDTPTRRLQIQSDFTCIILYNVELFVAGHCVRGFSIISNPTAGIDTSPAST